MKWMDECVSEAPLVCSSMLKKRESIVEKLVNLYCPELSS